jgi:hypothetical protein
MPGSFRGIKFVNKLGSCAYEGEAGKRLQVVEGMERFDRRQAISLAALACVEKGFSN